MSRSSLLKCPFCDYQPPDNKQGYLNQHMKLKHADKTVDVVKGGKVDGSKSSSVKVDKPKVKAGCPSCGGSDIRLLKESNVAEKKALGMGYLKICESCEEVF